MSVLTSHAEIAMQPPTVAIVASDAVVARRLRSRVDRDGFPVVGLEEATVALVVCQNLRQTEVNELRALLREHPEVQLLVLVRSGEVSCVRLALEAGASGVLFNDDMAHALGAAIGAVAAGQLSLPSSYRRQVAKPTFTTREKQILSLVILGLGNAEIGRRLYLAESTVKSHLSSAFNKLGVRSRNEATAMILDPASGLGPGIVRVSETIGPRAR